MVKLERRKLSLKKPVLLAGLVLTLMLAAFATVATGAHAAPATTSPFSPNSAAYRAAVTAAKSHKTKCGGGDFQASPCTVTEQRDGSIYFHVIGKNLDQAGTYDLDLDSVANACQNAALYYTDTNGVQQQYTMGTSAILTLDPSSRSFNSVINSVGLCVTGKNYTIMLLNISYPSKSYSTTVSFK